MQEGKQCWRRQALVSNEIKRKLSFVDYTQKRAESTRAESTRAESTRAELIATPKIYYVHCRQRSARYFTDAVEWIAIICYCNESNGWFGLLFIK
jgi:hypothetical protein